MKTTKWLPQNFVAIVAAIIMTASIAPIPILLLQFWFAKVIPWALQTACRGPSQIVDEFWLIVCGIAGIPFAALIMYLTRRYIGDNVDSAKRSGLEILLYFTLGVFLGTPMLFAIIGGSPLVYVAVLKQIGLADAIIARLSSPIGVHNITDLYLITAFSWTAFVALGLINLPSWPKFRWEKMCKISFKSEDIERAKPEHIVFGRVLTLTRNTKTGGWGILVERLDKEVFDEYPWDLQWFVSDTFPPITTANLNHLLLACIENRPSAS